MIIKYTFRILRLFVTALTVDELLRIIYPTDFIDNVYDIIFYSLIAAIKAIKGR
jgi:hypothetical protein